MAPRDTINLILLALGLGMLAWLVSLFARLRRGTARRDANHEAQPASRIPGESAGSPRGGKIPLILSVGMLGAVSGSCLAYFIIQRIDIDGWEKLPAPPQNATAILYVLTEDDNYDFDVFVQSGNGTLYSCSYGDPICSLSTYSAEQIARMAARTPSFDAEPGNYPSPPHGRIVDVCEFSGVPSYEVISYVALLEDGSLWFKPGAPYDVAALACPCGACAGGICGLIVGVGLAWSRVRVLGLGCSSALL